MHCSPGTSRTGTIIACDIVLRTLEIPPRQIDIPKTVYTVRRGRASAVQTKQQYEFIYKVSACQFDHFNHIKNIIFTDQNNMTLLQHVTESENN